MNHSKDGEKLKRHKEPYIFSNFGQKLQDRFGKFMQDRMRDKSPVTVDQSALDSEDELQKTMVTAVSKIPFYYIHPNSKKNNPADPRIPIMFSLLTLRVVGVDEEVEEEEAVEVDEELDDFDSRYFTLELQYGQALKWRIRRRTVDMIKLHFMLQWAHLKGHLQTPPSLPSIRSLVRRKSSNNVVEQVNDYFRSLFNQLDGNFNCVDLCEFLEISALTLTKPDTFTSLPMEKSLEGYHRCALKCDLKEMSGPRHLVAKVIPKRVIYKNLWIIIRSSYLVVASNPRDMSFRDVILIDPFFKVGVKNEFAKHNQISKRLHPFSVTLFYSQDKRLKVKPNERMEVSRWLEKVRRLAADSEWCQPHRFASFAPIRQIHSDDIEWLIDARQYFARAAEAIESACSEIFIHGWWVSPALQMLRPFSLHPQYRLDRLLQKKAEEGVKVYIVVFKEITLSLTINSLHTKTTLQKLHPNIKVLRHPDHYAAAVLYWAHHEKLLIVDQRVAFLGGLDLCYGRYDTPEHHLSDQGLGLWTGLDYANPRIKEYRSVTDPELQIVDSQCTPRMPWHDVQMRVEGTIAADLARHFIARWNFVIFEKGLQQIPLLTPHHQTFNEEAKGDTRVQVVRSAGRWSLGIPTDTSLYDSILSMIANAKQYIYIENQFVISNADSQASNSNDNVIKNKVISAIANKIIDAHKSGSQFKVIIVIPLLPAFEAPLERPEATTCRLVMQAQYNSLCRGPASLFSILKLHGINEPLDYVGIFSLRKYGRLEGKLVTEQIYVHTKALIVDDQVAFVGSANINDRSLLGSRDSEIGCIVEGGKSVMQLRKRLFAEHLDVDLKHESLDLSVNSNAFFKQVLLQTAQTNTKAYQQLFHCLPDDSVRTWQQYGKAVKRAAEPIPEALSVDQFASLQSIKGHLVLFSVDFLADEDLSASILSREFLLPIEIYI